MDRFLLPKYPRVEPGNDKDCEGADTPLVVTDQDQQNPEDGDKEGDLPTVATEDASIATDISNHPQEGPRRPVLQKYPARPFGNQQRSFNKSWMDQYRGWNTAWHSDQ